MASIYDDDLDIPRARALPKVRPEVEEFALLMEGKLQQKEGEGSTRNGWTSAEIATLLHDMRAHVDKLERDLVNGDRMRAQASAADVGNYAMFIAWLARGRR